MSILKPIKVKIQNFQSIKDIEFEIKGFTCLVGVTNVGKSAIIRAISSSILNKSVIGMVRHGTSHATVDISCEDWFYKWEKGEKSINRYTIGDKILDKVGGKQIEDIEKMGFKSVEVGQDEINPWLASQFFPIFLLDKPGSQVTDFISEVSRLNVLQDAILLSARRKRKANDELNSKSIEIKSYEEKISKFDRMSEFDCIEEDLDDQIASIKEYESLIQYLGEVNIKLVSNAERISRLSSITSLNLPEAPSEESVFSYSNGIEILNRINDIVYKIIPIKNISNVNIPENLKEYDEYSKMMNYQWVPAESTKVNILSNISNMQIPSMDEEEINAYHEMNKMHLMISKLSQGIYNTSSIHIPNEVDDFDKFTALSEILKSLEDNKSSIQELTAKNTSLTEEMKEIEIEVNKIPMCPTCSRPHLSDSVIHYS